MWVIEFLLLVIGGALAIPNLVISKVPNATEVMKKVAPYQPWFGLALLFWGLWDFLSGLLSGYRVFGYGILSSLFMIIVLLIQICLGLILSMNFLKQIKGVPQAQLEKLEKILTRFQIPLGIGGIIAGVYVFLRYTILLAVIF